MLHTLEQCTNIGERVLEVLCTKYPEAHPPTVAILELYPDRPPEIVPVDITDDTVTEDAVRLSGGIGPWETDSVSLQYWIMCFGAAIVEL